MPSQLFDRYTSTLASSYTAGDTTLIVISASDLPASGYYYLIIQAEGVNTEEVFKVSSRVGTTLTVVGAQWTSNASNHAVSAVVVAPIIGSSVLAELGHTQGTPLMTPNNQPNAANGDWRDLTIVAQIIGSRLFAYPSTWGIRLEFSAVGTVHIGAMVVRRTTPRDDTFLDSIVVQIGGNSAPTLTTPRFVDTDPISLALDIDHEYWFLIYFTTHIDNSGIGIAQDGAVNVFAGYADTSGDKTADSVVPSLNSGQFLVVGPIF